VARPTDFAYAAHAGSNTFLLDDDGICRRILSRGKNRSSTNKSTQRCLGAQYVASLDFASESGLVERPKEGCPLLFARVDEAGRVSLVRTAPLDRFEEIHPRDVDPVTEEHPAFDHVESLDDEFDPPPRTIRQAPLSAPSPQPSRPVPAPPSRPAPAPPSRSRRDLEALPPPPPSRRDVAPPTKREPPPLTRREPAVDSRRLVKTLVPGLPDVVRSSMKVDIDYLDPLDRTQQRQALDGARIADLDLDDDNATMIAERPAQFAKKRGMLPKERGSESLLPTHEPADDPRGERPTSIPPPPRGTEPLMPLPPTSSPGRTRGPDGRRGR
jgi:hypothetical protein